MKMQFFLKTVCLFLVLAFSIPTVKAQNIYYIRDANPWGDPQTAILNSAWGAGTYSTINYAAAIPATIFSATTSVVYMEGSDVVNPISINA